MTSTFTVWFKNGNQKTITAGQFNEILKIRRSDPTKTQVFIANEDGDPCLWINLNEVQLIDPTNSD